MNDGVILKRTLALLEDPELLEPHFCGSSWATAKAVLKAAAAVPMNKDELARFRSVAGDRTPPTQPVKELWWGSSRRSGKDSVASAILTAAGIGDYAKYCRPGERPMIGCIASDRDQAGIIFSYVLGYFETVPLLRELLVSVSRSDGTIELSNGNIIQLFSNSFRRVRGRTMVCCVFDELAMWLDERSAVPDVEVYNAVLPSLATIPDSLFVAISSPYRHAGLLYEKFCALFGKDIEGALFVGGASRLFNPTLTEEYVAEQIAKDPVAARSEWLGLYRDDVSGWLPNDVIQQAISVGITMRPPKSSVNYVGAVDVSGMVHDHYCVAIAHAEGPRSNPTVILDAMRGWSPGSATPDEATEQAAGLFAKYRVHRIYGDAYSAEWAVQAFKKFGIRYEPAELNKSEIYLESAPLFVSGRADILDHSELIKQLAGLERRVQRGGRETVDHQIRGFDDYANASCLALVRAAMKTPMVIKDEGLSNYRRPLLGEMGFGIFQPRYSTTMFEDSPGPRDEIVSIPQNENGPW